MATSDFELQKGQYSDGQNSFDAAVTISQHVCSHTMTDLLARPLQMAGLRRRITIDAVVCSLPRGSPGTGQGPVSGSGGSTTGPLAPADGNERQKDHEKPSCCKHIWNPSTNMSLTSPILCSGCSIGERSLGLSSKLFPPVLLLTGSSNIKLAGLAGWLLLALAGCRDRLSIRLLVSQVGLPSWPPSLD